MPEASILHRSVLVVQSKARDQEGCTYDLRLEVFTGKSRADERKPQLEPVFMLNLETAHRVEAD